MKFAFATGPLNHLYHCTILFGTALFPYLLRFEIELWENFAKIMFNFNRKSPLSQSL